MRLAIEVAQQGRGFVSPNPLVGCVIVDRDGHFLASGAHLRFGEAHAEVHALSQIQDTQLLKGATVYVTLEPCSHQGKTGACAKKLAELPIQRVVYGCKDPNPQVSGRGLELLKAHGIQVQPFSLYRDSCWELIEDFSYHIQQRKPYVVLKVGASFDGKIALKSGESQWITCEASRFKARQLRAHYDATFIGAGTLQYDNPRLDFRGTEFAEKKDNRIVILDPKGKAAQDYEKSHLSQLHRPQNVFVLTRAEHLSSWSRHLVQVITWDSSSQGWDQALKNLYQKGVASLYVEGGSYVYGQILSYQLAQKLYLFQSRKILGEGVSWSQYFQNKSLETCPQLRRWSHLSLGEDVLHQAYFSEV